MSLAGLKDMTKTTPQQLLHLVFGGELKSLDSVEFKDLDKVDIVGVYPNYATAYTAWKAKAQQTVDNAHMRYFIVHLHRLLDPTLSLEETARLLNVCPTTVRRYTNKGLLTHQRTSGDQRRFKLSDVLAFLEAQSRSRP